MLSKIKSFCSDVLNSKYIVGAMALVGTLAMSVPAHAAGLDDLIDDANTGFNTTTGFDIADVVTWSGDNLIKLFIGSGLAVLYNLRYWIVALVIISAIVYFAYRAFQFFRH